MMRWAAIGAGFALVAWLAYTNQIGIQPSKPPTAVCHDATVSYSESRSGTCSGSGGVREWLK